MTGALINSDSEIGSANRRFRRLHFAQSVRRPGQEPVSAASPSHEETTILGICVAFEVFDLVRLSIPAAAFRVLSFDVEETFDAFRWNEK